MALNGSGPISLGGAESGESINLELGRNATAEIDLNNPQVRYLAKNPDGQIEFGSFLGKTDIDASALTDPPSFFKFF